MPVPMKTSAKLYPDGDSHSVNVYPGDILFRKAEMDRWEEEKSSKALYRIRGNEMDKNAKIHGGFTLMRTNVDTLNQLSPATVGRLVYLSTYLDYDNHLVYQNNFYDRKPICKKDLQMVMGLGKTVVNGFYKECEDYGIICSDNRGLILCDQWYRGSRKDKERTRIYIKTVRNLYSKMKPTQHKYFGYIAMLIPFINKEWNIVCSNPDEWDPTKVKVLSIHEICNILGFSDNHRDRIINAWFKATFTFNGEQHYLCGYVGNGDFRRPNLKKRGIIINPHILFSGSHLSNVGLLMSEFNLQGETRS